LKQSRPNRDYTPEMIREQLQVSQRRSRPDFHKAQISTGTCAAWRCTVTPAILSPRGDCDALGQSGTAFRPGDHYDIPGLAIHYTWSSTRRIGSHSNTVCFDTSTPRCCLGVSYKTVGELASPNARSQLFVCCSLHADQTDCTVGSQQAQILINSKQKPTVQTWSLSAPEISIQLECMARNHAPHS